MSKKEICVVADLEIDVRVGIKGEFCNWCSEELNGKSRIKTILDERVLGKGCKQHQYLCYCEDCLKKFRDAVTAVDVMARFERAYKVKYEELDASEFSSLFNEDEDISEEE